MFLLKKTWRNITADSTCSGASMTADSTCSGASMTADSSPLLSPDFYKMKENERCPQFTVSFDALAPAHLAQRGGLRHSPAWLPSPPECPLGNLRLLYLATAPSARL